MSAVFFFAAAGGGGREKSTKNREMQEASSVVSFASGVPAYLWVSAIASMFPCLFCRPPAISSSQTSSEEAKEGTFQMKQRETRK
jgi:hypothetical protein